MGEPVDAPPSLWLAHGLGHLRVTAGVSPLEAAAAIGVKQAHLGHLENARRPIRETQLRTLLPLYRAADLLDEFLWLREQAKDDGDWREGIDDLPRPTFARQVFMERLSTAIESYNQLGFPGIVQTRETAAAIIRAGNPDLPGAEIARRVEVRMARGRNTVHRAKPPLIRPVITEAALRLEVGGVQTRRAQLEYLLDLEIELQVLPYSAGEHAISEGPFTILSPPRGIPIPGYVYVEDYAQDHYYADPDRVAAFRTNLDRLRSHALEPGESRKFISRLLEDL